MNSRYVGTVWGEMDDTELLRRAAWSVTAWWNEIDIYRWGNLAGIQAQFQQVGHFTQIVWDQTTHVGSEANKMHTNGIV